MALTAALVSLVSCSDDGVKPEAQPSPVVPASPAANETTVSESKTAFARILSAAVSDSKDVREFLKAEALKKFDKNYDVLYLAVKDEMVGDKTFRQVLASYASEGAIDSIEANVPLLNIYLTRTAFLDIYPEDLDVDDKFTPVAVEEKDSVAFFCEGVEEFSLAKGEIPDCHVFVVGENSRVVVDGEASIGNKSLATKGFRFKDQSFDGSCGEMCNKSAVTNQGLLGTRAIQAFNYFYADDNSVNRKELQRDYIYYGLTPNNRKGNRVLSVSEYLAYIKISPSAMNTMADQDEDPRLVNLNPTKTKGSAWTYDELLNQVWTRGAFNIRFDIVSSNSTMPQTVYIPLTPDQLWDMSYTCKRRHKTWFRHNKYYYTIYPDEFTAKDIYLDRPVDLGKWDIEQESLCRYINIFEEDKNVEKTRTVTYEMDVTKSDVVKDGTKINLGTDTASVTIEVGGSSSSSNQSKSYVTVTEKWSEGSDNLGRTKIEYYDPVIDKRISSSLYLLHTYSTGTVEFGIVVK